MSAEQPTEKCCFTVRFIVRDVVDKQIEYPCPEKPVVSILQDGETPDLLSYACEHHLFAKLGPGTNVVTLL